MQNSTQGSESQVFTMTSFMLASVSKLIATHLLTRITLSKILNSIHLYSCTSFTCKTNWLVKSKCKIACTYETNSVFLSQNLGYVYNSIIAQVLVLLCGLKARNSLYYAFTTFLLFSTGLQKKSSIQQSKTAVLMISFTRSESEPRVTNLVLIN